MNIFIWNVKNLYIYVFLVLLLNKMLHLSSIQAMCLPPHPAYLWFNLFHLFVKFWDNICFICTTFTVNVKKIFRSLFAQMRHWPDLWKILWNLLSSMNLMRKLQKYNLKYLLFIHLLCSWTRIRTHLFPFAPMEQ